MVRYRPKKDYDLFINHKSYKKKIAFLFIGIFVLILILNFFVKPSIIGYMTYQKMRDYDNTLSVSDYMENINELDKALKIANTNLTLYKEFNDKLFEGLSSNTNSLNKCEIDLVKTKLELNYSLKKIFENNKDCLKDLNKKDDEIKECHNEMVSKISNCSLSKIDEIEKLKIENEESIQKLKLAYNLLAKNLANNKCCKEKVDDPTIDSFIIENEMILCVKEGNNSLEC